MPLDPQVEAMRADRAARNVPQLYAQTLAEARAADLASIQAAGGQAEPVHHVENLSTDAGLPLRLYRPDLNGPLPTVIYFFGGGWTLGSIDTADGITRRLVNAVPCQVITVGYRLAPEHPFPAAVHDCHDATQWIAANADKLQVDPARIVVAGDSAGGNLAAATTLLARDHGPTLAGQLLVYPNTKYGADTQSMRTGDDPYLFNRTSVGWYWGHYLTDVRDGLSPLASPLLAESHAGLPPALVITAEYDPLRDEGEFYAEKLHAAGVPTVLSRYDGMVHGFFAMPGILDGGQQATAEAAAWLNRIFAHA
ncbi:alpha/beta hydrolase [Kribbella sandramycini]|uniref:Acetyl esterase n=1 Tax=Kribbella sandramycini TaxID=60450 RepID=A0A7Y4L0Z3_9ACTN|nr:alpha/beta hydrolase [Kribbella sandramycini]MBB6564588.1 acetyl esterase [Kribbella sandramycini]NOL42292.1 alpha/beta hydrolase [Kribbella sandramycini]